MNRKRKFCFGKGKKLTKLINKLDRSAGAKWRESLTSRQ